MSGLILTRRLLRTRSPKLARMSTVTAAAPLRERRQPAAARDVRALSGLLPFLRPYRGRIALAGLFLVLAARQHAGLSDRAEVADRPGLRRQPIRARG